MGKFKVHMADGKGKLLAGINLKLVVPSGENSEGETDIVQAAIADTMPKPAGMTSAQAGESFAATTSTMSSSPRAQAELLPPLLLGPKDEHLSKPAIPLFHRLSQEVMGKERKKAESPNNLPMSKDVEKERLAQLRRHLAEQAPSADELQESEKQQAELVEQKDEHLPKPAIPHFHRLSQEVMGKERKKAESPNNLPMSKDVEKERLAQLRKHLAEQALVKEREREGRRKGFSDGPHVKKESVPRFRHKESVRILPVQPRGLQTSPIVVQLQTPDGLVSLSQSLTSSPRPNSRTASEETDPTLEMVEQTLVGTRAIPQLADVSAPSAPTVPAHTPNGESGLSPGKPMGASSNMSRAKVEAPSNNARSLALGILNRDIPDCDRRSALVSVKDREKEADCTPETPLQRRSQHLVGRPEEETSMPTASAIGRPSSSLPSPELWSDSPRCMKTTELQEVIDRIPKVASLPPVETIVKPPLKSADCDQRHEDFQATSDVLWSAEAQGDSLLQVVFEGDGGKPSTVYATYDGQDFGGGGGSGGLGKGMKLPEACNGDGSLSMVVHATSCSPPEDESVNEMRRARAQGTRNWRKVLRPLFVAIVLGFIVFIIWFVAK